MSLLGQPIHALGAGPAPPPRQMATQLCWNMSPFVEPANSIFGEHRLLESSSLNRIQVHFSLTFSPLALLGPPHLWHEPPSPGLLSVRPLSPGKRWYPELFIVKMRVQLCPERPHLAGAAAAQGLKALGGENSPRQGYTPLLAVCLFWASLNKERPCHLGVTFLLASEQGRGEGRSPCGVTCSSAATFGAASLSRGKGRKLPTASCLPPGSYGNDGG